MASVSKDDGTKSTNSKSKRKVTVAGKENTDKKLDIILTSMNENDMNIDDSVLTELFMCTNCTKTYRLKHSLTRHMKLECGREPKFACEYCGRRFKHKYDLRIHEKSKHQKGFNASNKTTNSKKNGKVSKTNGNVVEVSQQNVSLLVPKKNTKMVFTKSTNETI